MLVPLNEPGIGPIAQAAFPGNRKPVKVEEFRGPHNVNSYWDDGSKSDYRLVSLETRQVWAVPTSHPFFDRTDSGDRCGRLELRELPPNTALVSGGTFCGKPATVRVMLRPENMVKMLPAPNELTAQESAALRAVGFRGGYRSEEFNRQGLGEYSPNNPLVQSLASKGLVSINRAGAVQLTIAGRNARG